VAWYDDASLYFGAPSDVLAQGDIVVATTGVFERPAYSKETVATFPRRRRFILAKNASCRCGLALPADITNRCSRPSFSDTMYHMRTTIRRLGNSQGVAIPRSILDEAGFAIDSPVEMTVDGSSIVLRKIAVHPREGWGRLHWSMTAQKTKHGLTPISMSNRAASLRGSKAK
jgi:antitoxin MazE